MKTDYFLPLAEQKRVERGLRRNRLNPPPTGPLQTTAEVHEDDDSVLPKYNTSIYNLY